MKRIIIAGAAGVAAVAAVTASAASLGGFSGQGVGAGDSVVASCDTDGIGVSYQQEYNPDDSSYWITGVVVGSDDSPIATLCNNLPIDVTVAGAGGTALSAGADTVDDTIITVALTTPDDSVSAELVESVAVIISGNN